MTSQLATLAETVHTRIQRAEARHRSLLKAGNFEDSLSNAHEANTYREILTLIEAAATTEAAPVPAPIMDAHAVAGLREHLVGLEQAADARARHYDACHSLTLSMTYEAARSSFSTAIACLDGWSRPGTQTSKEVAS